tara:strand:+ start:226 stop:471 length:246 start_codon:yes stop_codon:yes gene_type:complete
VVEVVVVYLLSQVGQELLVVEEGFIMVQEELELYILMVEGQALRVLAMEEAAVAAQVVQGMMHLLKVLLVAVMGEMELVII